MGRDSCGGLHRANIHRDDVSQCAGAHGVGRGPRILKIACSSTLVHILFFLFLSRFQFSVRSCHGSGLDVFRDYDWWF